MTAHGPVRILHIAESARGGVGTYLNEMLPALERWQTSLDLGWQARVLLPSSDRSMLAKIDDSLVETYDRQGRDLPSLHHLAGATWRMIDAFRPDIVHLHSTFAGAIVRPLLIPARRRFRSRLATVYSAHGFAFQITGSQRRQDGVAAIERYLSRLTDKIINLSDAEKVECIERGLPSHKLVRIYNGVATEPAGIAPTTWEDPRLKVFFIGRFDRQKGLDILIEAARMAPDQISVRCAGTGVVDSDLKLSLPENVRALGWLSEEQIAGQLAQADILVVPSRWEGFGLAAIEAMRAGLPVVASRVGGLPEVVDDKVTGRLVPPEDTAALLAALLQDDACARQKMGMAGRQRFTERFTAAISAQQLGQVYRSLANPSRTA